MLQCPSTISFMPDSVCVCACGSCTPFFLQFFSPCSAPQLHWARRVLTRTKNAAALLQNQPGRGEMYRDTPELTDPETCSGAGGLCSLVGCGEECWRHSNSPRFQARHLDNVVWLRVAVPTRTAVGGQGMCPAPRSPYLCSS